MVAYLESHKGGKSKFSFKIFIYIHKGNKAEYKRPFEIKTLIPGITAKFDVAPIILSILLSSSHSYNKQAIVPGFYESYE
jgi:hypothetical protein